MIHDDSPTIREFGLRRILKARSSSSEEIRRFSLPSPNLNASRFYKMIDWQNTLVSEIPATKRFPDEELKSLIINKEKPSCILHSPATHTQGVERAIKLVTEASSSVVGEERDVVSFVPEWKGGKGFLPLKQKETSYCKSNVCHCMMQ